MRRAGFASNGFSAIAGCVVYIFSEGFRVQDIATILHVGCTFFKKANEVVKRDFNRKIIQLNARAGSKNKGTWMVCLYYVLY